MSIFRTCGEIADRYAMIEQIASDGFAYLSPGNEQEKIIVGMQLSETDTGVAVRNIDEIELNSWVKYLRENPTVKIYDSKFRYAVMDLDWNFDFEGVSCVIGKNAIALRINIKQ